MELIITMHDKLLCSAHTVMSKYMIYIWYEDLKVTEFLDPRKF